MDKRSRRSDGHHLKSVRKAADRSGLIYNERRQGAETEILAHVPEGQKESSASVQSPP